MAVRVGGVEGVLAELLPQLGQPLLDRRKPIPGLAHQFGATEDSVLFASQPQAAQVIYDVALGAREVAQEGPRQLGGLAGVAELAQAAGELMVFVRADDPAMLHEAVQVCDDVRARLAQLAAAPGADDTAPIVRMPAAGAVSAAIDDGGTSATSAPREIRDAPTPRERRT